MTINNNNVLFYIIILVEFRAWLRTIIFWLIEQIPVLNDLYENKGFFYRFSFNIFNRFYASILAIIIVYYLDKYYGSNSINQNSIDVQGKEITNYLYIFSLYMIIGSIIFFAYIIADNNWLVRIS